MFVIILLLLKNKHLFLFVYSNKQKQNCFLENQELYSTHFYNAFSKICTKYVHAANVFVFDFILIFIYSPSGYIRNKSSAEL